MQFSTLSSLDDYPETARLLGNLTVSWSHAERMLYFMFWVISGTSQQKAFDIYESVASFRTRYDLIVSLFRESVDEHPKMSELLSYAQTLNQCFQFRNELTHRTWVLDENKKLGLLDHRIRKKKAQVRAIGDEEIRNIILLINGTCDKIFQTLLATYPHAFQKTE